MISITIPGELYTMEAKRSIIKINAERYKKASKKEKNEMLNDLEAVVQLHRKHITKLLNNTNKVYYTPQGVKLIGDPTITFTHKRGRKKTYTKELVPYLEILWELSGFRASPHLIFFIREHQKMLFEKPADLQDLTPEMQTKLTKLNNAPEHIRKKLLTISPATVDRLLKKTKARCRFARTHYPHPHASVIKKNIPVESYFDKPKYGKIGYQETDLVHHCDSNTRGDFCYTLTDTEINTDWTELRALRNRAQVWTESALKSIDQSVPFVVHSRHVDNDSVFINAHVLRYAQQYGINYTRSRPYHKNDNPYVESRNWTMVRSYVGYRRYETEAEYRILKELMLLISLRHNYFIPTQKLRRRVRVGGHVYRVYNLDTPYNRVLKSPQVTTEKKQQLQTTKESLSYFKIVDQINSLLKQLDLAYHNKFRYYKKDKKND